MEYKELGIGNKINMLRVKDATGARTKPKQYVSQLLDLDSVNKIAKISMPIENKVIVPLEIGDIYRIIIYTTNGLFQCMAKILKRYKEGSLYMLDIQLIGKLEKHQRRQYFRLMCDMKLEHRAETVKEAELKDKIQNNTFADEDEKQKCIKEFQSLEFEWLQGEVVDVSGGGIRFKCNEEYAPESVIVLKVPVVSDVNGSLIPLQARVIRCTKDYAGAYARYDVRAEFLNIDNRIREKLVRYIFDEQRRRMKR